VCFTGLTSLSNPHSVSYLEVRIMPLGSYSPVTERAEHCKNKSLGFRFAGIF
jgi:hypothetical protein